MERNVAGCTGRVRVKMASSKRTTTVDAEMEAMKAVYAALSTLEPAGQTWVLRCVSERLGLSDGPATRPERTEFEAGRPSESPSKSAALPSPPDDDGNGINQVAAKWLRRIGLDASAIGGVFSFGDEIDLIAKKVPGSNKKERMRSVILLKGVAAYLATGAARVQHAAVKEACTHYDAHDTSNFATHLSSFAKEVGGSKESGFTLTPAGLAAAAEIMKNMATGANDSVKR
jgi:hypothetical protein